METPRDYGDAVSQGSRRLVRDLVHKIGFWVIIGIIVVVAALAGLSYVKSWLWSPIASTVETVTSLPGAAWDKVGDGASWFKDHLPFTGDDEESAQPEKANPAEGVAQQEEVPAGPEKNTVETESNESTEGKKPWTCFGPLSYRSNCQ